MKHLLQLACSDFTSSEVNLHFGNNFDIMFALWKVNETK